MTRTEKIVGAAALLLLGLSIYVHMIAGYVGDRNWLLIAARMVLSGKRLYVDVFESNPPLIVWLYTLPVCVAARLHIPDYQALVYTGLLAVALCIAVSERLVRHHPSFADRSVRQKQFALLLAVVFISFTTPTNFFDREHILLVMTFPYVLRFMPGMERLPLSFRLRVLTGVMAGIGFCIKPHTAIIFVGLQLFYLLRERSLRILGSPENICIYMVAVTYLMAVEIFAPEYFSLVLPMALVTYSGYSNGHINIMYLMGAIFTFAITFADFRLRYTSPYRSQIFYLSGVSFLWLVYALVNNGWGYTYNPLISTLLITCGFVLFEHLWLKTELASQSLPVKPFIFGARACTLNLTANAAIALYTFALVFTSSCADFQTCQNTEKLVTFIKEKHFTSYGALTINYHLLPMLTRETGAQLQTRFHHLWMLPAFYKNDVAFTQTHRWILDYVAHALADDLNRRQPQLVLVNTGISYKDKPVDVLAFFTTYSDFKEAWSHYRPLNGPDVPNAGKDFQYNLYERVR